MYFGFNLADCFQDPLCSELCDSRCWELFLQVELDVAIFEIMVSQFDRAGKLFWDKIHSPGREPLSTPEIRETEVVTTEQNLNVVIWSEDGAHCCSPSELFVNIVI